METKVRGRETFWVIEKCLWGCPGGGAAAEVATVDGDAFNFLTDCVTSATARRDRQANVM